MGNVNMEAYQIHNNDAKAPTVQAAIDALSRATGNQGQNIAWLEEEMLDKAEKTDIAPEFDATANYFVKDLVYHNNQLYIFTAEHDAGEWNVEEVSAVNLNTVLDAIRSGGGGGGLTEKTLRYTGNGAAANVIDFGEDTPAMITGIYPDPDETYAGGDYNIIEPFGWGNRLTIAIWAGQSGGLPSGGGGTNMAIVSYSGNVITITSANTRAACNVDTQAYVVKYLA